MDLGNRIPENTINELRDKCDIVEYISRYVNLKKRGSNYLGLCPFHKEKTPSFVVSKDKKIFHCFGCGEGGNLFHFLSKIESKSFYQVIKDLAKEKGIQLDIDNSTDEYSDKKARLTGILFEAMQYYHESLYADEGGDALKYLKGRGITEHLITEHKLGYSPKDPSVLYNRLVKIGFKDEDIMDSGIFSKGKGGIQDRFSQRLIIPLIDIDKKTVAFAGRTISKNKDTAKYINSPESLTYHKGSFLYGLNVAARHIQKTKYLIVVEGYFDLIALNSINIFNVVATCGTALTQSHIKQIKRFCRDVFLCFDGDSAGRAAVYKASRTLLPSGAKISVIRLPDGYDPDKFVRESGHQGFSELLQGRLGFLKYLASDVKEAIRSKPSMKATFIKKMLEYVNLIPDIIEQREAIRFLAGEIDIEEDVIYSYMRGIPERTIPAPNTDSKSRFKSYEIWALSILFQFPSLIENLPDSVVKMIESREISESIEKIIHQYKNEGSIDSLLDDSPIFAVITEVLMNKAFPENESDAFSILLDCISRIQVDYLKKEIKRIDNEIKAIDSNIKSTNKNSANEERLNLLLQEKMKLSKSIKLREIKYG